MSNIIIQESIESWLTEANIIQKIKNYLMKFGYVIGYTESPACNNHRKNNKEMYLLHGTRKDYVKSIKKKGLLLSESHRRSKEEDTMNIALKPTIWFSSNVDKKSAAFGEDKSKEVVYLVAKVSTEPSLLKPVLSSYNYFQDVKPSDIIFEDNPKFKHILKNHKYLIFK